ncbi:MAG: J domain-containing protein [Deltaproteobacteria bacterium]|nr:MAG: J domain-containing protein [Deltaproteobacteria bacterium]
MEVRPSAIPGLAYYVCPRCRRRLCSDEPALLHQASGSPRRRAREADAAARQRWAEIRARMDAWVRRLDATDPYQVLGLRPRTPFHLVRRRFHQLAALHHPDHGGDPARMRAILEAYQAIRSRQATAEAAPRRGAPRRTHPTAAGAPRPRAPRRKR